jgi:hypothetical protein
MLLDLLHSITYYSNLRYFVRSLVLMQHHYDEQEQTFCTLGP